MVTRMLTSSPQLNVMINAAMKAARGLVRDFGEVENLQVSRKSLGDFVSTADREAEKTLIRELSKARPNYGFLVEESGEILGADPTMTWIIDPLDGTTNFLHGVPHFAISIALKKEDEIVAGVVYNPITDEMFWAEKGKGTFLNQQRRMRVSGRRNLDEALVATGTPFGDHGNAAEYAKKLAVIMPHVAGIRRFGAASLDLAYVAAGRFDAYFESDLQPWDIAAGLILVKEAGGYTGTFSGEQTMLETGEVLVANESMFGRFSALLS